MLSDGPWKLILLYKNSEHLNYDIVGSHRLENLEFWGLKWIIDKIPCQYENTTDNIN